MKLAKKNLDNASELYIKPMSSLKKEDSRGNQNFE